jgi:hypothetical protein
MRSLVGLAAAALVLGFASQASALSFTLDDSFGSDPVSGDIVITLTNDGANTVRVDIDLTALNSTEFIKELYLNTNTAVTGVDAAFPITASYDPGAYKSDGDGFHDLLLEFSADAGDRLTGGDVYSFTLSGLGLDESDFDDLGTLSDKGQFHAVAKINGTGDGSGSDWVGDGGGNPVPEPSAAIAVGAGLLIIARGAQLKRR